MLSKYKKTFTPVLEMMSFPLQKIHPHYITTMSLGFTLLFFFALVEHSYVLALILFLGQLLDSIDGYVARKTNRVSAFGGFLDSTIDRISDFFIITAFGFANLVSWPIVVFVLATSFLVSYIRSRAELATKGEKVFNQGLIERPERLIIIFLSLLLFFINANVLTFGFILLFILNLVTITQRIYAVYKNL